jgi:site-specific recombinase XerD
MKGMSSIERQVEKIFKHTRQGSFATRARYENSAKDFARFCADKFKLQNFKNVQDKHLIAYAQHRHGQGIASKTIKNDLAAIRYTHDQVAQARHQLSDNQHLATQGVTLDKTPDVKGNRAWVSPEIEKMKDVAIQQGKVEVANAIDIARTMGLRVAEVACMRRSQAEAAIRTGQYQVQNEAKNGKWRIVPVSPEAKAVLEKQLENVARGERMFVQQGEKAHQVISRWENWLDNHRSKAETLGGQQLRTWTDHNGLEIQNKITWHGLRYCYAQERMDQLQREEKMPFDAAAEVLSKELGHNREEVVQIYLGGK